MGYQVLARKWRPFSFQNMVGQQPILRMLSNALEQKRLHHAYLFTGTRGVGKTTIARILAACLNCENGITANPCGQCAACQAIQAGHFLDLFEVDAASRTKVEDTRELLENVPYPPATGRYKIYLIDEVHMLSNHSFNALLKTLEEPPEHVKFLLATTDPKRLPITILSRCLQFHLKKIPQEEIANHLQTICETDHLAFEPQALEKLAKVADGSMRDALSLLDQAIAYGKGTVHLDDVRTMIGSINQADLFILLQHLIKKDSKALFESIKELASTGPDFHQVLEELIHILHEIALIQVVPDALLPDETIQKLANSISAEDIQIYYQIALIGRRDLSLSVTPLQGFEMIMLRMLSFKLQIQPHTETLSEFSNQEPLVPEKNPDCTPMPTQVISLPEWRTLLPKLGLTGLAHALAANCTLSKLELESNKIELTLAAHHQPMLNAKLKERIQDALSHYYKKAIHLTILITKDQLDTPIKQAQKEQEKKLIDAKSRILENPQVKKIIEMYDATVDISIVT